MNPQNYTPNKDPFYYNSKIYWFFKDIILGLYYGYPWCCIWEFAIRMWKERPNPINKETAKRSKWVKKIGYMPCKKCFEKLKNHSYK